MPISSTCEVAYNSGKHHNFIDDKPNCAEHQQFTEETAQSSSRGKVKQRIRREKPQFIPKLGFQPADPRNPPFIAPEELAKHVDLTKDACKLLSNIEWSYDH